MKKLNIDIRNKLATEEVQKMLSEGKVIAFVHPETFGLIKGKIGVHPNLNFIEVERVEKGTIMFSKQPSFDPFFDQLFSKL